MSIDQHQGDVISEQPSLQTGPSRACSSLTALFYKSVTLHKKNYCTNICQLLTPIICFLFAFTLRIIQGDSSNTKVDSVSLVQPFHMPYINKITPGLNIRCVEKYYYSFANISKHQEQLTNTLFSNILKTYCSETQKFQPEFIAVDDPNKQTFSKLKKADKMTYTEGEDVGISLPDGLAMIHNITSSSLNITLAINDWQHAEYHVNNGVTKLDLGQEKITYVRVAEGLMSWIEKITRSFLQIMKGNEIITGSFMYMPFVQGDHGLIDRMSDITGGSIYPLGFTILLPVILYSIVSEKEERLIEIMKMNGLQMKYYWVNFFVFYFGISLFASLLMFLFGKYVFQTTFFVDTDWLVLWTLFLGWSISQISLATFLQIFINNSKVATITGYVFSFFGCVVCYTLSIMVDPYPGTFGFPWIFIPTLALGRGVYLIGIACSNNTCFTDISNLYPQMYTTYIVLYMWIIMFFVSIYLHEMIQQEYGTAQVPQFIKTIINFCKGEEEDHDGTGLKYKEIRDEDNPLPQQEPFLETLPQETHIEEVDESVSKMAAYTSSLGIDERPLIVKKLEKVYDNGFQALKPNTFHLERRQIFGLLGANGAGKTTFISVLTGLYGSTSGMAWIDGKQVGTEEANTRIGVCPQFDLLWPSMSIEEHMYFYAMLKGVEYEELDNEINDLLRDVDLLEEREMRSDELSGGMKRRLSLAIALVGRPKVVILDEPSSGLDPMHRRQIWNILAKCKKRTTILLTTHLMQEAEALCDRIGIINRGALRCVGTQQQLKEKFGKGYRLAINFRDWGGERERVMQTLVNSGCEVADNLQTTAMVKVPKERLLECVRKLKNFHSLSWLLSQPSLYDVFMHFAK